MTEGHDPYNHNPYGTPLIGSQWTAAQIRRAAWAVGRREMLRFNTLKSYDHAFGGAHTVTVRRPPRYAGMAIP